MLVTLLPVHAFAVETESAAESTTLTVTLKNYDGTETLGTLEVENNTVTQNDMNAIVDELDRIRGD